MTASRVLAVVAAASCLVVAAAAAAAPSEHAVKSFPMRITFDGVGRAKLTCDANAECVSAGTQASWHREWLYEFPGNTDIKPPTLIDYFAVQSKWHLKPPCNGTYMGNTRLLDVGANDVSGQLKIQTTVPLTEEEGQVPQMPSPNSNCIGVSVSSTGGVQPGIVKLENASADFGSYQAWASAAGYAQSRLVSGSYSGVSVGGVATPGRGQWDWVGALSVCSGSCFVDADNQNGEAERLFWVKLAAYVLARYGNLSLIPAVISPADWTLTLHESVQPTRTTSSARAAFVPFATLQQQFRKGRPTTLKPTYAAAGRSVLAKLKGAARFEARFQLARGGGRPQSGTFTFSLAPVPPDTATAPSPTPGSAGPTISSVTFGGSSAAPSFVVHGSKLGKLPPASPATHPSGHGGCPVIAGDNGYDYGASLYVSVPAKHWSGGRGQAGETDCIDLVVTKFTAGEVDFHFGPFYTQNHAQFSLDNGDAAEFVVNGADKTVHVRYGATVSG